MYVIQRCFICCLSYSTVSEDAGIEPRAVSTLSLKARRSNQYITRLDLLRTRLDLIHTRLDLIHTRLDLIHTRLDLIHYNYTYDGFEGCSDGGVVCSLLHGHPLHHLIHPPPPP
jgi:hypothetical protein